ncbi:hypothetical protein Daus18300_012873 [Diaporthe australafricana]|uniref:Uncharacterized protein n=1 Tax=Diaporthe australafricana TaxID=127596 RepID=A0ABR3W167_9PEZI
MRHQPDLSVELGGRSSSCCCDKDIDQDNDYHYLDTNNNVFHHHDHVRHIFVDSVDQQLDLFQLQFIELNLVQLNLLQSYRGKFYVKKFYNVKFNFVRTQLVLYFGAVFQLNQCQSTYKQQSVRRILDGSAKLLQYHELKFVGLDRLDPNYRPADHLE